MYKLTYKGQFVDGFDTDQVIGNLAQLLNLKPKAVRLAFLSDRPSVIKMLDSASEVERWCAAFQEAGVYLDVANISAADANNIHDQIELDLELHQLDDSDEEPDERHYLIRKVHVPSEPDELAPDENSWSFKREAVGSKHEDSVNGHSVGGHIGVGGDGLKPVDEATSRNPADSQTGVNGNHYHRSETPSQLASKPEPELETLSIEPVALKSNESAPDQPSLTQSTWTLVDSSDLQEHKEAEPVPKADAPVHELSVAAIDALAARELEQPSESEEQESQPGIRQPEPPVLSESVLHSDAAHEAAAPEAEGWHDEASVESPDYYARRDESAHEDYEDEYTARRYREHDDRDLYDEELDDQEVDDRDADDEHRDYNADKYGKRDLDDDDQDEELDTTERRFGRRSFYERRKDDGGIDEDVDADVDDRIEDDHFEEDHSRDDRDEQFRDERFGDQRFRGNRFRDDPDYDDRFDVEEEEELLEDVDFHKSYFKWGMLVILLAIFATAGAILWLKRSTWAPVTVAPNEQQINAALASASLFGLVHADVQRLQALSPATDVFASVANPARNFWQGLSAAGVQLNQQVDDLWIGVYGQNDQTKLLWVLQGNFAPEVWNEWLKKSHLVHSDSPEGLIFSTVDETSCELSTAMSASVSSDRIVLGAPELVAAFTGRLQAGAAAERNLETWAKGYNTQMISAALFQPGQMPGGTAATALGKLSLSAEPIQGIYLGLEPRTFPPSLRFDALIDSNNQQFATDAAQKLAAASALAKTTLAVDWPETLPLYQHLKVSSQGDDVLASLHFDEQAPKRLKLLASSLVGRAFAPDVPAPALEAERIEENLPQFTALASAELPPFTNVKHFNEAFVAQTSSGPFGIGIRNVEQTDNGTEINVDVNAFNLPNLGKDTDSIALRITDIVDHQDQSLLAETGADDCAGGIKQPAKVNVIYQGNTVENGQPIQFTGIQGVKKIMLPANIALSSVGAVKGTITHQLPTNIERVRLGGPLAGKTVDLHGVQLRFMRAEPNRLHFHLSGNVAALLHVQGLSAAGNPLVSSNSVRTDAPFTTVQAVSIDYQGQVAAAEIVVASKIEQKTYDFSIARLFPPAKQFTAEKVEPEQLTTSKLTALEKDSPPTDVVFPFQTPRQTIAAGPALMALNDLSINGQQFSLAADIYTRNTHPLVGQLSAVRLMLTDAEDSSGNLHPVDFQAPIAMEHMGGNWADGKFEPDPNRPWLRGQVEMRDRLLEQPDVIAFWGKLVFLAAEDPVPVKVPFQFGMQWNSNNGLLKLRRWEAGRLIFDVDGEFPELMAVKALDEAGNVVSQPAELRTTFGRNTIELDVKQIPDTIEFHIARTQKPTEFPVEIRILQ